MYMITPLLFMTVLSSVCLVQARRRTIGDEFTRLAGIERPFVSMQSYFRLMKGLSSKSPVAQPVGMGRAAALALWDAAKAHGPGEMMNQLGVPKVKPVGQVKTIARENDKNTSDALDSWKEKNKTTGGRSFKKIPSSPKGSLKIAAKKQISH